MDLTVVVPAFNESRRIARTLASIADYLDTSPWTWELVVVDDGSADDTADKAERFARADPRVAVLRAPHRGKGAAVRAGIAAGRGDFRFMCDADLSMSIDQIVKFLPPRAPAADVIIATREGPGAQRIGEPEYRHIVGRVFNFAVRRLLLPGIHDSQCGFKMFTAAAAASIFPAATVDGWGFDLEVLALARQRGLRIAEIPIAWQYGPESRVRIARDAPAMFKELLTIRRRLR